MIRADVEALLKRLDDDRKYIYDYDKDEMEDVGFVKLSMDAAHLLRQLDIENLTLKARLDTEFIDAIDAAARIVHQAFEKRQSIDDIEEQILALKEPRA